MINSIYEISRCAGVIHIRPRNCLTAGFPARTVTTGISAVGASAFGDAAETI
jgi:hypothetical protein